MIIGAGLDARLELPLDELSSVGREAAALGFESLWTPAGGVPDAFFVCGAWSESAHVANGDSIRTGIAVVPAPRMWNPASLAAQAATVGVISRGQFILGIGTGGAGARHFAAAGMPNRPIAVMRDYLTILRGLLAGEEVTHDGPALRIDHFRLGGAFPRVPVYLAALGPQMLVLAGAAADGASLNWATPEQIAWSREQMLEGAASAGRDPSELTLSMYIRVCIDDDVEAARRAFAAQVLGYALARPGSDPTLAYRGHFGRMGFEEQLRDLEARREAGAKLEELVNHVPEDLLQAVGYYGPAAGAAERFAALSAGLDETMVRVVTARKGPDPVIEALEALTPAKIRAAA
jgi:alkanesulfonate monooxygenase SsuD/methylene tetrahydromethanopterin reductase-like flavin-dependent oxidoreductase (luciferase family)